jgi:hypothetical protein
MANEIGGVLAFYSVFNFLLLYRSSIKMFGY